MSIPSLKIAIIGAGPAGLTLAAILQRSRIPFTVFDLEAGPNVRNQGGTLDLHPQSGQSALKRAGLWEGFVRWARREGDVLKIVDLKGEVLWDGNVGEKDAKPKVEDGDEEEMWKGRPEIDRERLKEILLEGVDGDAIRWGKKLKEVRDEGEGKWSLIFEEEVLRGWDLVVGADGAWSKVRKALSDVLPYYSGVSGVEFWAEHADEKHPFVGEYVGEGSLFSFGEGRAIQAQRMGNGTIRTYGNLRVPEAFLEECGIDWDKKDESGKEYVARYFGDCDDKLKRLLLESDDQLVTRTLYMLPVGFRWKEKKGVTLLGDAAHLMTPFGGVGVNAAMWDSLNLADEIVECVEKGKALDSAIRDYEAAMFPRGEKFAQKSAAGLKGHFSADGNEHFIEMLKGL